MVDEEWNHLSFPWSMIKMEKYVLAVWNSTVLNLKSRRSRSERRHTSFPSTPTRLNIQVVLCEPFNVPQTRLQEAQLPFGIKRCLPSSFEWSEREMMPAGRRAVNLNRDAFRCSLLRRAPSLRSVFLSCLQFVVFPSHPAALTFLRKWPYVLPGLRFSTVEKFSFLTDPRRSSVHNPQVFNPFSFQVVMCSSSYLNVQGKL